MSDLTPIEAFSQTASTNPQKIAFRSNDVSIGYGQALTQIRKFAAYLEKRGVRPGDLVLTMLPPRIDWYVVLALHSMGVTSCSGHSQIPSHIQFDWVLVLKPKFEFPMSKQIIVDSAFLNEVGKSPERIETPNKDPNHLLRLILTSGTTGISKAVPVTLGSLHTRHIRNEATAPTDGKVTVTLMGIGSVTGGTRIFYNAWSGSYFVTPADRGDWKSWVELVSKVRPFQLGGSPVQLESFFATARQQRVRFDFLGRIASAGTVFPNVLAERIGTLTKAPITSVYGSTEAGQVASKTVGATSDPFELGEIHKDVEYQIVDENGNSVPEGTIGNLRVKTVTMATEYFMDPEATRKYFKDGWFYPGDEAFIGENGRVFLAGRTSEFVNAGGVKIDPTEVDQAISRLTEIRDGAAFGVENSSGNVLLALGYVPEPGFDAKAALEKLKSRLKGKHPTVAFKVSEIPRNEMGKVMRHKLKEMVKDVRPDASL
jgi:acyl-coenzyme A synthetase/AMP-(fatty) acid ligase